MGVVDLPICNIFLLICPDSEGSREVFCGISHPEPQPEVYYYEETEFFLKTRFLQFSNAPAILLVLSSNA